MSTTRKVSLSAKAENRPVKASDRKGDQMPERVPMTGRQDILGVGDKDPSFSYRWVKDVSDEYSSPDGGTIIRPGQNIQRFIQAGWTFVIGNEVTVATSDVYKTESHGSVIRKPAGMNEHLFLMKINREWYEQDQAAKEKGLMDVERQQAELPNREGMYGSVSIEKK